MPITPLDTPPVHSAADVSRHWAALLAPATFATRSLWLTWIDAGGRVLPLVMPLEELPVLPDPRMLRAVLPLHDTVVEQTRSPGAHLALALCRPGPIDVTEEDLEWEDALREELEDQLDGDWSFHVAADGQVRGLVDPPAWERPGR